ncbi:AMP-binding protein [Gordonia alkanivorans]|uniref:AMP-binding protein n=1 Tax=Gordonia alkanivorans TaxID=84096 RepID=UPI00244B07FB|nr:AMP-binding protein [Gordonia alkanivorans]MDH3012472.1 AMP-binding protein [Gordonia alkanivorans]MDH3047318.1 AMP-binding protein [Gordonia alkanivorans]MDH3052295.1 AMP-binding protein [Gordonia alkanivorans]
MSVSGAVTQRSTVAGLLADLSAVTDRGVHFEESFTPWARHLHDAAVRAGVLLEWLSPERPPHVGVLLSNTAEFAALFAAAARHGFVLVGLNTTRRGAALAADVARADCQIVLYGNDTRELLTDVDLGDVRVVDVDGREWSSAVSAAAAAPLAEASPDDLLMLIFTSGTTGDPKAVRCTHRTFAVSGPMLAERFEIGADDVVYLSMPMFHSNAMIAGWSVAVAGGASIALRRSFSARGFVADLHRYGVTYANYVGKPLNYILATDPHPDDPSSSLRIMYGNEASAVDRKRFAERFGCRVVDGFGSTEGGVAITRTPDTPHDALGPLRAPTAVVDVETGQPVPTGVIGEIVNSSGPGLFAGYYNDPDSTAERMHGGIYHTGDLAWVDDDGYLHFAGRLGDWLRVDGENLGTGPIERILLRHRAIRQAAVHGVPVEIGDEIEAVVVVDGSLNPDDFAEFLSAQDDLGPKQWPHRVRIVDALPETATFKTVKRLLAANPEPPTWRRDGRAYRP